MENTFDYTIILILGSSMMILLVTAVIFFIYLYQRKLLKRKIQFQEIESLLKEQEIKSSYKVLEVKEEERSNIARELHDNLGSILTSLNMHLDTFETEASANRKEVLLGKIKEIAQKATQETRTLSHRLEAVTLKHFGLETSVKDLVETIQSSGIIQITASVLLNVEINAQNSLDIYRIIQELINNTLKHSEATKISIELSSVGKDYLSLIYQDNGKGFNVENKRKGMGLSNINARINNLNGSLTIESGQKGSVFIFEIPLS